MPKKIIKHSQPLRCTCTSKVGGSSVLAGLLGALASSIASSASSSSFSSRSKSSSASTSSKSVSSAPAAVIKAVSVKLPCVSEQGALQDYLFVIIDFENFSNGCFRLLSTQMQTSHNKFIQEIATIPKMIVAGQKLGKSIVSTRSLTKPADLSVRCTSPEQAITIYSQVVLDYAKFSGRGCWFNLPKEVKEKHCAYVNMVCAAAPPTLKSSKGCTKTCKVGFFS